MSIHTELKVESIVAVVSKHDAQLVNEYLALRHKADQNTMVIDEVMIGTALMDGIRRRIEMLSQKETA